MEFSTKEELVAFLTDLQGQIANLQETVDKMSPVEQAADPAADPLTDEPAAEDVLPDEEELNEIDKLLQSV